MKKLFSLIPILLFSATAVGCNTNENTITVWCDVTVAENMRKQLEDFKDQNPDFPFNTRVDTVSESNTATNMITDVSAGADLYIFVQDSFSKLYAAGALSKVPKASGEHEGDVNYDMEAKMLKENKKGTCDSAYINDGYYAFPMTADAGYFLYYDKSVINDEQVKTLEGIIEATKAYNANHNASLKINFNKGMWYTCSFYISKKVTGYDSKGHPICEDDTLCHSDWSVDTSGNFIGVDDTYCYKDGVKMSGEMNPNAYIASYGLHELLHCGIWEGDDDAPHSYDLGKKCSCIVDGTWDYDTAVKTFNDLGRPNDLGCTKLPTFTISATEQEYQKYNGTYQLGSLKGSKLLGIKSHSDGQKAYWCAKLGSYLSGERCQRERYDYCKSYGPSNQAVLDEVIKGNNAPQLDAIMYQNEYGTIQGIYPSDWYTYGNEDLIYPIRNLNTYSEAAITNILQTYATYIKGIIK